MTSFKGFKPTSLRASSVARAGSRKRDSRCELLLRQELWRRGHRFLVDVATLPGRPDIVFTRWKVAIFCDGDFWHGRQLHHRLQKLAAGHNSDYWMSKIKGNAQRDRENAILLRREGWQVLRFWETDIAKNPSAIADTVERTLMLAKSSTDKQ